MQTFPIYLLSPYMYSTPIIKFLITTDQLTLMHCNHLKSIIYIKVNWCTFYGFGPMHNVQYIDCTYYIIVIIVHRVFSALWSVYTSLVIPTLQQGLFYCIHSFFYRMSYNMQSFRLLSIVNMHLSFLYDSSWLDSSLIFSTE